MAPWMVAGQIATLTQVAGVDAIGLITMIVQASQRARTNRKMCKEIAEYLQVISGLLVSRNILYLKRYPETRAPLERLEDALRSCYILITNCQGHGFLHHLVMGWNVEQQLRKAESEIDRYLKLIPLIALCREKRESFERDQPEHVPDEQDNNLLEFPSSLGVGLSGRRGGRRRTRTVVRYLMRAGKDALACSTTPTEHGIDHAVMVFTLKELRSATGNFAWDNVLGRGHCTIIYKGMLHGNPVAVKRLEGKHERTEFIDRRRQQMQIARNFLSLSSHPNLIKLLGYCSKEDELHVYEFMDNRNLEHHLRQGVEPLSWDKRIKIAIGTARALEFLHMPVNNIIHRNVKPSTILLDSDFNAKLSGFWNLLNGPEGEEDTVEDIVYGTSGCIDPEYVKTGLVSTKADVYAFGVVLLQILSGRKVFERSEASDDGMEFLLPRAAQLLEEEDGIRRLMDPRLHGRYPSMAANKIAKLALSCTSLDRQSRPNMEEIVKALDGIDGCENLHQAMDEEG